MSQYIKRPKEVTAKQWFRPGHEKHDPSMLIGNGLTLGKVYSFNRESFLVRTSKGVYETIEDGFWIIVQTDKVKIMTNEKFNRLYMLK